MNKFLIANLFLLMSGLGTVITAQQTTASPQTSATKRAQVEEWSDDFKADKLDEKKWEKFTFEGASGGKIEVKDGEVKIRGASRTRAGIRTKDAFAGDRFVVEARLAKVGSALPEPGSGQTPLGFGALTILFDGSGRNRIEWLLTSEGTFEAWAVTDGRSERIDSRKLATKMKNPVLLIVRKGDEFSFYINDPKAAPQDAQLGLKAIVKNMPKSFHIMLYGYGSSENNWDNVLVSVQK